MSVASRQRFDVRLHGWRQPPVIAVALLVLAAGFGQFGAVVVLGDVAESFGEAGRGGSIAEQAGLSGTALGVGLGVIRLASIVSLPLAGLADRVGRRPTLLWFCGIGLLVTASAALSPTYWWFVGLFALSRPFLTATDTVAEVSAAEQTATGDRAKALALVAAAYGIGSGLIAVVHGFAAEQLGFRGVFTVVLVAMLVVPFAARRVREPDRFRAAHPADDKPLPLLGAVGARHRRRLGLVVGIVFAVAVVTGPANSFIFLYIENVLELPSTTTAGMVVAAAPAGVAGLLAGRWAADTLGRRVTGAAAMVAIAAAGILTYLGPAIAAVVGYLAAVAAGSMFAPPASALAAELFPTDVRAAVAGSAVASGVVGATVGLMGFGALADAHGDFGAASVAVFTPAALVAVLFAFLPETRGRELEEWDRD